MKQSYQVGAMLTMLAVVTGFTIPVSMNVLMLIGVMAAALAIKVVANLPLLASRGLTVLALAVNTLVHGEIIRSTGLWWLFVIVPLNAILAEAIHEMSLLDSERRAQS